MDHRELQKMKEGFQTKGIALLLTMAMSLLFLILVAGFYQTVIGRQRWTHKRGARSQGSYKAEAGTQDAIARLRLGRLGSVAPPAIDPHSGLHYCLDLNTSTILASSPPPVDPVGCVTQDTDNVLVRVGAEDPITKLNRIDAVSEY